MKLVVSQLNEGENRFEFESPKEAWLQQVVQRISQEGYHLPSPLQVEVNLTKLEPDYYLRGSMRFTIEQNCARCAEGFVMPVNHTFHVAMAHLTHGKSRSPELMEESEELDINFFEGNEIDLSPVIEEQFFLSLPYQSVCQEDCKGICQQCGKNRNIAKCTCVPKAASAFSVLQNLVS